MDFEFNVNKFVGSAKVRVEGFFTERVINLCKIQNIKIWNIKNITSGLIEFEISVKDVKRIKSIIKKCKCKIKVSKKKGIYFKAFKYRKRKMIIVIFAIFVILIILYNKFIWKIEIIGNNIISKEEIVEASKNAGIFIGAFKPRIDTGYVVKCLQKDLKESAWVGAEIIGNKAIIRVVEKTKISDDIIYDKYKYGDIVAKESGFLTKVIAENGTQICKEGSYVEKGMIIIKGSIISEYLGESKVSASGIVKANVEYEYKKQYYYSEIVKNYR